MIWYDLARCDIMWFEMIWYDTTWYDMIRYDMTWYDMIWYDVMWCDMMWCDMMWYDMMWRGIICDVIIMNNGSDMICSLVDRKDLALLSADLNTNNYNKRNKQKLI